MAVMLIVVALLSGAGVFFGVQYLNKMRKYDAENEAKTILDRARQDAENYRREAELELKEASIKQKEEIESEKRAIRQAQAEKERQLDKRQIVLDQQGDELRKHERSVQDTRKTLSKKIEEQGRLADELREKIAAQEKALYEVLNLTKEEASRRLLEKLDKELTEEEGAIILRHEKEVNERCESAARKIILLALQRYAAAHTAEATTSTVDIPNDEMKGRVIGREGRNIRAFEKITGVDVIIDDTPGVVIVSAFDAIRREAARLTLTRLIADGRIHPSRIEEIYDQTTRDIQAFVQRVGEEACQEAEVARPHERVVNFLGRLYFRTSYSLIGGLAAGLGAMRVPRVFAAQGAASRPGARRETLEHYVKRMEELEKIAMEFPFVEQAFAVQAGREMRVIVNSQLTTDESAAKTCRDIVKELTARLQFPGEIKVTVIRETRATDIAK